ncbi:MAG: bifunctional diaminohydroxyphosphoribosylaminopyrimidine deaminase/5-amino-6-(5-phosphoribosylamino)uracil reductase RibD [Candidatus Sumerlaeia bacterium]|nr:bifunctional diaminohydroxyphosphoribosylaminopyrimidine deaminase/5-amino-6-(5-phosphoribosylamino)uracil reductase RibD [Candidatus Sumerlaeia bacterium]
MLSPDERHMRRALELARRAWGQTRPNPLVGCVLARGERVLAEGWHARAGQPHAEAVALAQATEDPRGATAYVTLEPCAHHGRTPPCADALIAAGIARVVVAARDPNPKAHGGLDRLRAAGIAVESGLLETEAHLLNPGFHTLHRLKRPLVTLKWAMTADGCTSAAGGHAAWISSPESRRRAHVLRAEHDAMLVGVETALRDQARLTIRDAAVPPGPPLLRIVLDAHLRLPPDHPFVQATESPAVVVCGADASVDHEQRLRAAGADVWRVETDAHGTAIALPALLAALHARGVQALLVEGGRRVAGSFLTAGVVDRVAVFLAPKLIASGTESLGALRVADPPDTMLAAREMHHVTWTASGPDMLLEGWLTRELFADSDDSGAEPL